MPGTQLLENEKKIWYKGASTFYQMHYLVVILMKNCTKMQQNAKVNMLLLSIYRTSYTVFYFTKQRLITLLQETNTRPGSAVGSESDWRSRGHDLYPGPVPYLHGDWSWHNFYGHSPLSADSRRAVVNYKRRYVHEVLVNHLVKLAQEKKCS